MNTRCKRFLRKTGGFSAALQNRTELFGSAGKLVHRNTLSLSTIAFTLQICIAWLA
jgi:hypothetical protein